MKLQTRLAKLAEELSVEEVVIQEALRKWVKIHMEIHEPVTSALHMLMKGKCLNVTRH